MTSHHKSEDYKLSAVQHYLESDKTQEETCSSSISGISRCW